MLMKNTTSNLHVMHIKLLDLNFLEESAWEHPF